jgi:hypothetical protein
MLTRFTPEARDAILAGLRAGLTLGEAAHQADMPVQTVKNWLARGRSEEDTDHAEFAEAVDAAREAAALAPMGDAEFLGHVARAVRSGSVQAMKLWNAIRTADPDAPDADPFAELDAAQVAR